MRVVVAMSGGVDSSVSAARLVEAGHEVIGMSLQLWGCGVEVTQGPDHKADARAVCDLLGIPFHIVEGEERFRKTIVDYFISEYHRGRTPSPCVKCNEEVKFALLFELADSLGAHAVATGHYARIERGPDGLWRLLRGRDRSRDQSYYLSRLKQPWLPRVLFPVGDLSKVEVRAQAARIGLPVADKADSQELCFVADNRYVDFVEREGGAGVAGDIVDESGRVLGRHGGLCRYTVGQRKGLGIAVGRPLYVTRLEPATGRVVVGDDAALFHRTLVARDCTWVSGVVPGGPRRVEAKIRYRARACPAEVVPGPRGEWHVTFDEPQRAPTPGQAVVFYDGDEVLGGGWIDDVCADPGRSDRPAGP